jgi:uncharacterized protein YjbJ (UPF0337 family)
VTEDRIEGATRKGFGKLQDAFGAVTGDARTQAEGKLNEAAGSVQDAFGQARERAEDVYALVEDYAKEQPVAALAITLGVGLVLGLVLGGAGGRTLYVRR